METRCIHAISTAAMAPSFIRHLRAGPRDEAKSGMELGRVRCDRCAANGREAARFIIRASPFLSSLCQCTGHVCAHPTPHQCSPATRLSPAPPSQERTSTRRFALSPPEPADARALHSPFASIASDARTRSTHKLNSRRRRLRARQLPSIRSSMQRRTANSEDPTPRTGLDVECARGWSKGRSRPSKIYWGSWEG